MHRKFVWISKRHKGAVELDHQDGRAEIQLQVTIREGCDV